MEAVEENTQVLEPLSKSELSDLYFKIKDKYVIDRDIEEKEEVKILKDLIRCRIPKKYIFADIENISQGLKKATEGFEIGKSYYIYGGIGTGKTYLVSALTRKLIMSCREKKKDHWWTAPTLYGVTEILMEIKGCFKEGSRISEEDIIKRYTELPCLILDDIGTEKISEWVLQTLYSIVDNRYSNEKQTIFTSNLTLDQIRERVGDRIPSRIAEMCTVIQIKGKDRRIQ